MYFHVSLLPTISTNQLRKWKSGLQFVQYWVPTVINFKAYLSVRSVFSQVFYFDSFNYNPLPIILLFCYYFCFFEIYGMSCAVVMVCHPVCFLCRFQDCLFVFFLTPVFVLAISFVQCCSCLAYISFWAFSTWYAVNCILFVPFFDLSPFLQNNIPQCLRLFEDGINSKLFLEYPVEFPCPWVVWNI